MIYGYHLYIVTIICLRLPVWSPSHDVGSRFRTVLANHGYGSAYRMGCVRVCVMLVCHIKAPKQI